jgi:DNA-binding transcriptional ArsR family regulator
VAGRARSTTATAIGDGEARRVALEDDRRGGKQTRRQGPAAPDPHEQLGLVARRRLVAGVPADRRLDALLPFDTREVVAALRDAKRLSTMEVADRIGMSRPATLKRLNAMTDAGLVEMDRQVPEDPRAYWRLRPR